MIEQLCHIINLSFDKGYVPYDIKYKFLFQKRDTPVISDYRPISVSLVFSKIFETIVYSTLTKYINKHNVLSNYQF